ncbi:hypothetical protein [Caulobacter sp. RHG1]|uniref:hypothetical protein n=1 Tax=Caulobacter sp. (strain RHG1) TaxID=2545762 RepID=UPI001551C327|nr:hypothetical protein [Caulobacter sp. RHG1]NQE62966.1 hypothetical protein [Caulobacter sp. RHG1]
MDPYVFTPPPTPPTTQDPTNFDARADALVAWLVTLTTEHQAFANLLAPMFSQLALAAAPGGIVLTYTFDGASAAVGDPGNGKLRLNNLTQGSATAALADNLDNQGVSAAPRLALLTSTSAIKGTVFIYQVGNPLKWMVATATANTAAAGYANIALSNVQVSAANPFDNGADLVMILVPKGDKGDQGNVGPASAWVLDNTFNPTGTPNLITLAVPSGFNDLKFEIDGVVPSGVDVLYMAVSTNGSTFSSLIPVNTGNLAAFYGNVELAAYNTTMPIIRGAVSGALGGAPAASSAGQIGVGNARVASAVTHVRFGLGNGANTFVAGGAIRTYRK